MTATSLVLIGVAFVSQGILMTFVTMSLGDALASLAQMAAFSNQPVPDYTAQLLALWVFTAIQYVAGLATLVTGVAHFREKAQRKK